MYSRLRKVGRLIHLVEHTGGARRENLLQVVIIFYSYLFREKKYSCSCWREARRKIGEWSSCGSPQVHHFLFLSRTFSFSFVFFSHFPCKPIPHFYNQFLDTLPFHCIKNQINDPEDSPPSLRCCDKQKS